jgi:hypothetical protein
LLLLSLILHCHSPFPSNFWISILSNVKLLLLCFSVAEFYYGSWLSVQLLCKPAKEHFCYSLSFLTFCFLAFWMSNWVNTNFLCCCYSSIVELPTSPFWCYVCFSFSNSFRSSSSMLHFSNFWIFCNFSMISSLLFFYERSYYMFFYSHLICLHLLYPTFIAFAFLMAFWEFVFLIFLKLSLFCTLLFSVKYGE